MAKVNGESVPRFAPEFHGIIDECIRVLGIKGEDYTAGEASRDRLYNFREAARQAGVPMEKVWFTYFFKHYMSLVRYVRDGKVESEPIRSRIVDLVNYLLLFSLIVDEKERK